MNDLAGGALPADVYANLAKPDRIWLRRAAADLRVRLRRSTAEVVRAGKVLAQARRRLGRQHWRPWLAVAGVPRRSASRLIAVHRTFGAIAPETLARFSPTALYTLAEPGTPQALREYAVEQAEDGAAVTDRAVGEWLAAYRAPCPGGTREASKDEPADVDPRVVYASDNWLLLDNLLAGGGALHLSRSQDSENDDVTVAAVYLGPDGERRMMAGSTLEQVLLRLTETARAKICPRCPPDVGPKPLDQFSKRKDRADGRNRYCLACEAARVRLYARRKSAGRKAG